MIRLSQKNIEILKKYNIEYKNKIELNDLLDTIDDVMVSYVDKRDEPLKELLELEKLYDNIYDNNLEPPPIWQQFKDNERRLMILSEVLFSLSNTEFERNEESKICRKLSFDIKLLGLKAFDVESFSGKEKNIMITVFKIYDNVKNFPDDIIDNSINKHTNLNWLLKEYFNVFPKENFFPEWFKAPDRYKIEMLNESIKYKKDISETEIFANVLSEKIIIAND